MGIQTDAKPENVDEIVAYIQNNDEVGDFMFNLENKLLDVKFNANPYETAEEMEAELGLDVEGYNIIREFIRFTW